MNKQLIEECKAIYNQFTGIGDDEDYMWQEVIDYASNQQNEALLAQIARLHSDFREIERLHDDLFTLKDAKVIAIQAQSRTSKQCVASKYAKV